MSFAKLLSGCVMNILRCNFEGRPQGQARFPGSTGNLMDHYFTPQVTAIVVFKHLLSIKLLDL
jgi:hypothetical protein